MTDTPAPDTAQPEKLESGQLAKILVDIGPIAVFMITFNVANGRLAEENKGDAIFIATGVFMVATFAALAYSYFKEKRVSPMLIVSGVIVGVFGGLTLILQDALFIKLKPTIVNGLYASVLLGGLVVGVNVWKRLFSAAFTLPDKIWNTLALRWGLFFIFLAVLNEAVWRTPASAPWIQWFDTDPETFWANFKFFGVLPITLAFAMANVPITLKYNGMAQMPEETGDRA